MSCLQKLIQMCVATVVVFMAMSSAFADGKVVDRLSQSGFFERVSAQAHAASLALTLQTKYTFESSGIQIRHGVSSYRTGPSWARITQYRAWAEAVYSSPFHGANQITSSVWIENPLPFRIFYKMNGQSFFIDGNHTRQHTMSNANFHVEFDCNFAPGYQQRSYRLYHGSRNYFHRNGNNLDLFRR